MSRRRDVEARIATLPTGQAAGRVAGDWLGGWLAGRVDNPPGGALHYHDSELTMPFASSWPCSGILEVTRWFSH